MPQTSEVKNVKEILSALKEVHGNIKDLVVAFTKLPPSQHRGVSGDLNLTTKEKEVIKIIQREQDRADELSKILVKTVEKI